ncbi:MAG: amidohydrolase family protein [Proteobacteria bacterium]|nr:amidohydrolase family protein [Pseudomonadota bacterium]
MSEIPFCAAPDPRPRTPRLATPADACDSHAHVFGPATRYPYQANRGYTPPDATDAAYEALHRALGIARGVLTQPSVYGIDNRRMLDAVAAAPQRLRAVAAVDGAVTDDELARLDDAGVRGIRVNLVDKGGMPFESFADVARMTARIAPLGWHLELLVHAHDYPDFRRTMAALPVDVVVGHLGYMRTSEGLEHPGFRDFLKLVADGHCWVKLTAPYRITTGTSVPYADVAPFARRLIETRPDRMLWGSDWPHVATKLAMPNDGDLLGLLSDWAPDAAVRRQILVDNPARLYGFASGYGADVAVRAAVR